MYGIQIWGNTYPTYLRNEIVFQNRGLRIIGGGKWSKRVAQYYIKFYILKLSDMYSYEAAKLMHKYCNNRLRYNFNGYFSKVSSVSSKDTRLSNQKLVLNLPRFQLSNNTNAQLNIRVPKYGMLFLIISKVFHIRSS